MRFPEVPTPSIRQNNVIESPCQTQGLDLPFLRSQWPIRYQTKPVLTRPTHKGRFCIRKQMDSRLVRPITFNHLDYPFRSVGDAEFTKYLIENVGAMFCLKKLVHADQRVKRAFDSPL